MLNRDGCLKDFTAFSQLCIPSCKFFSKRTEKSVKIFIRKINFQTFKWCDGADMTILYIYIHVYSVYIQCTNRQLLVYLYTGTERCTEYKEWCKIKLILHYRPRKLAGFDSGYSF